MSNMGFLEHHQTRIRLSDKALHCISPNIAVMIAAASSARKSSLIRFTTDLILSDTSPCEGMNPTTREIMVNDATLKGLRQALLKYRRCSVTTDEIVNSYYTTWSENAQGVHYFSRTKMCTYLNAERDDQVTATGRSHIDG